MKNQNPAWIKIAASLGLTGAITYAIAWICEKFDLSDNVLLASRFSKHMLLCRRQTSDMESFRQIFIEREYACLDDQKDVRLIVDCGAYVGYSSAYFLSRFPNSNVIAIEPDSHNFSILRQNLSAFGSRVKLLQAAVWSHPAALVFSETKYGDGEAWSRHVRECNIGESPSIGAIDISQILEQEKRERISILKVDIEGAEGVVFQKGGGVEKWIDKVDVIAIELHDDSDFGPCSDIFLNAISEEGFEISRSGELTICKRAMEFKA
jgi:FkbM family methyltransferase